MSECAISIDKLDYFYRTDWLRRRVCAVRNLSLEVAEGEAFGFLGHNGAGKTSTIKCILGLTRPSRGTISIFGVDHREPRARAAVGFVPEQPYFYDYLTVQETLELYARLKEIAPAQRSRAIHEVLDAVQLSARTDSRLRSLSKGLMQRVAMAQALLGEPRVLILDEPFSGLDPVGRKEFRDLLAERRRRGVTIFVSSHILSDIECLCDRASIMVRGEIKGIYDLRALSEGHEGGAELVLASEALTDELRQELLNLAERCDESDRRFTLQLADRALAERALGIAFQSRVPILSFAPRHKRLEDIFVSLVPQEQRHG